MASLGEKRKCGRPPIAATSSKKVCYTESISCALPFEESKSSRDHVFLDVDFELVAKMVEENLEKQAEDRCALLPQSKNDFYADVELKIAEITTFVNCLMTDNTALKEENLSILDHNESLKVENNELSTKAKRLQEENKFMFMENAILRTKHLSQGNEAAAIRQKNVDLVQELVDLKKHNEDLVKRLGQLQDTVSSSLLLKK
jgi:hypothetical protein